MTTAEITMALGPDLRGLPSPLCYLIRIDAIIHVGSDSAEMIGSGWRRVKPVVEWWRHDPEPDAVTRVFREASMSADRASGSTL